MRSGNFIDQWDIEEYKVWKGIDPDKPVWHRTNIVLESWDDAVGMLKYISKNSPDKIFRIMKRVI